MADSPSETVVQPTPAAEEAPTASEPAAETKLAQDKEKEAPAPAPAAEPVAAPVVEKADVAAEPTNGANAAPANADPKPAVMEEPKVVTGVEEPKTIPAEQSAPVEADKPAGESEKTTAEPEKPVPESEKAASGLEKSAPEAHKEDEAKGESALSKAKEVVKGAVEDVKDTIKKHGEDEISKQEPSKDEEPKDTPMEDAAKPAPVEEKAVATNGASQDVEMTDSSKPETQLTTESQTGEKRKADEVADTNGAGNTQDMKDGDEPVKKVKVAEAAPAANGAAPSRKKSKKGKNVSVPAGRTARRTRSQGLADQP